MSVLVKGMEMPENCRDCEFWCMYRNSHRMYCKSINRQLEADEENEIGKKRLSDCPLIEVPAPHGDLIDIDSKITIGIKDGLKVTIVRDLLNDKAVRLPKTVIEAEGTE